MSITLSQLDPLKYGCEDLKIKLTDDKLQQFIVYYEKMIERNKVMNLTTITELQEVIEKHFLDSLSLADRIDLNQELYILDLGDRKSVV